MVNLGCGQRRKEVITKQLNPLLLNPTPRSLGGMALLTTVTKGEHEAWLNLVSNLERFTLTKYEVNYITGFLKG